MTGPTSSWRSCVRMPMAERALVAMGVAALANHAMTQRGGLRRRAAAA